MLNVLKTIGRCFWRAGYIGVIKHDAVEHAGYLAYVSMLALFPFLVLLVVIAGFLGQGQAGSEFINLLFSNLPPQAVQALKPRIEEISGGPPQGLVTISVLGAIWTASSLVEGMRTVLNNAYNVSTPPAYLLRRLMSILQLIIFTIIVIVAMLMLVLAPLLLQEVGLLFGMELISDQEWDLGNQIVVISACALFLVVANLYYILPNIKQKMMDVVPGAAVTVILWLGAAALFSYYLSHVDQVNLIYGSLGGIIASLIFFFINNLLFILGAEFNYQLAVAFGFKVEEREKGGKPPKNKDMT